MLQFIVVYCNVQKVYFIYSFLLLKIENFSRIEGFFVLARLHYDPFLAEIYIWQAQRTSFLYTSWLQATEALDIMSSVSPMTPTATARSRAVVAVKTKDKDNDDSDEEDDE